MALCSNIATDSDQDTFGGFEFAQIGAASPSGIKSEPQKTQNPNRDQARPHRSVLNALTTSSDISSAVSWIWLKFQVPRAQDKPMNVMVDPDRIALIDPSDFTAPYNLALAGAIEAQGRWVRLVGQAGGLLHRQGLQHGHFYPILDTPWGRRLPGATTRLVKGACQGVDMFRLFSLLTAIEAKIAHFQWSPIPALDCWIIRSLRWRLPVVLTWHDSLPGNG